jgi:quinol monooxygenase YgiN
VASEQVSVIARAKARPGMEEQLMEAIQEVVGPTRSEEGCINYDLHRGVEDPSELVLYENWQRKADLDEHLSSPHVKDLLDKLPELSEDGVEITLFEMVSVPAPAL